MERGGLRSACGAKTMQIAGATKALPRSTIHTPPRLLRETVLQDAAVYILEVKGICLFPLLLLGNGKGAGLVEMF
jgi:hypothetical protein